MASGKEEWKSFKSLALRTTREVGKIVKDEFKKSWREGRDGPWTDSGDEEEDNDVALLPIYQYEPLRQKSIRLLEILPAQNSKQKIQCRLWPATITESTGRYETLSYVWGSPEQPRQMIIVNGAFSLEIYETLHTALINLRDVQRPRIMWVDAICIHQTDISERNAQIPLMRDIYRDALRTIVWLGPDYDTVDETFEMLYDLLAEANAQKKAASIASTMGTDDGRPAFTTMPSFNAYLQIQPASSKIKNKYNGDHSIFNIISALWWQRAWTVQELLLSPNVIVYRGRHTIEWNDLCTAVDHGLNIRIWVVADAGFVVNRAIIPYGSMRALLEQRRLGALNDLPAETLLTLLMHCRYREAKDPRDKVYSIMGILLDLHGSDQAQDLIRLAVKLDYDNPVVYIYRQISQQVMQQTGNLDILGTTPVSTRRALPSWVTDWSVTAPAASPLMYDSIDHRRKTHAAKGTTANPRFPSDAVTLVLKAHEIATVSVVSDVLQRIPFDVGTEHVQEQSFGEILSETHQNLHLQAKYWRTMFKWEKFAAERTPKNPCTTSDAVYWQTLCTGTYVDDDVAKTEALYRAWLVTIEPVRTANKRLGGLSSKVTPALYALNSSSWKGFSDFAAYVEGALQRRMGWSSDDYLCLLPEAAKPGDKIILAEGGRVPLVIRSDGDGYHMFVGEAYVQGVMNGEAFEPEKCIDIKIC